MADVTIRAKWDGQSVQQGVTDLDRRVKGLGVSISSIKGLAGAAFGIGGAFTIVNQLGAGFRSVNEEFRIQQRLLSGLSQRSRDFARDSTAAAQAISRLQASTPFSDDELMTGLDRLIRLSGDAEASIKNLGLVADIAAGAQIDLERASKVVAFAIKGEIDQAARLAPEIRALNRDLTGLKGTSSAAEAVIKALDEQFRGAAAADTSGFGQFKKGLAELRDSLLKMVTGGSGANDLLKSIGDAALQDAQNLDKMREAWEKMASTIGRGIMGGGQTGQLQWPFGMSTVPHPNMPGATSTQFDWRGLFRQPPQNIWPQIQSRNMLTDWDFVGPTGYVTPPRDLTPRPSNGMPTISDMIDEARISGRFQRRRGGIRGGRRELPMQEIGEHPGTADAMIQEMKDKDAAIRAAIAAPIEGGILAGMQAGGQGMVDYFKNYIMQQIAVGLASAIAGAIVPGGGGALGIFGGLFSSILGGGGGGGGGAGGGVPIGGGRVGMGMDPRAMGSFPNTGGLRSAAARSAQLRVLRLA